MRNFLQKILLMFALILFACNLQAQRKMENLGRGIVVLNKGNGQAYIGWRMLGTDPSNVAFNVYKSYGGANPVKLNLIPITNSTNFTDNALLTTMSNAYFVKPIFNGVEQAASASFVLPSSPPAKRYIGIPQQPEPDGGIYTTWQTHVGDVNGDGEFEYICVREYDGTVAPTTRSTKIDCYTISGSLLWRVDLGMNFTFTANGTGSLVVADLNGDGKSEVALRTFEGTCFRYGMKDSLRIGDTNADGKTNYRRTDGFVNDGPEFLSVLDGITGKELARTPFEPSNGGDAWAKYGANERPYYIYMAVAYLDGVLPSVVTVRGAGGDNTPAFAFDYRNGVLSERWRWVPTTGQGLSQGHNILVFDLDNDGKDEISFLGSALDHDGSVLYANRDFAHGDHYRVLDMDPDRPGYEIFSIQQNNGALIGMSINDGLNGKYLKKWFMSQIGDLSRGDAGDYNASVKGAECYSTMGGLYSCKGDKISSNGRFPTWGIWWNSDLQRELINGVNASGTAPAIDTWGGRIYSIYSEGVIMPYGGHPPFWGDVLGDWREEIIVETSDHTELRIYSTYDVATNRLYTLMHNPGYKMEVSCKGRIGGAFPDYYLGGGMQTPPPPPMVDAKLHWKGIAGNNKWDKNTTASWENKTIAATFNDKDTVLFDLVGDNSTPIVLSDSIKPGYVTVYSPIDYTFNGTGCIAGATALTKAGKGTLTLNNKNTYTGNTVIWDGAFIVNDTLPNSNVTVNGGTWGGALSKGLTGGRIGGHGCFGSNVTIEYGGAIVPGVGVNSADTLTIQTLTEKVGAANYFDLSSDPTGQTKKNDMVNVLGNLTFTDTINIAFTLTDFVLTPGTYTLFKYAGTFTGNVSKIKTQGLNQYPYTITNTNGAIVLNINSTRPAAKVVWAGTGNQWDLAISSNWLRNGESDIFATRDSVLFDNTGSANSSVMINNDIYANEVIFDGTTNYTIKGEGSICGTGKLTKRGTSTVRLTDKHKYVGATIIEGGTLEIGGLDEGGASCSIGSASATAGNLQLNGGSELSLIGLSSSTNRPVAIKNGECTFSSISGSGMSLLGVVSGNGTLVKSGPGILQLNATNTYTGNTIIREGKIVLGSSNGNRYGIAPGTITFEGGSLYMSNVQNYDGFSRNLIVPTGATAEFGIDGRCSITSTLTGGGTLTVYSPYVRGDLSGNWSAFTGKIIATGSDFRINNGNGYANAALNLTSGTTAYRNGGYSTSFGEISGEVGSTMSLTAWVVGSKNTNATFEGTITGNSINKVGTGAWTLTGANTYTGTTTVSGGKLLVNNVSGSGTGTGAVTVNNGGTIGGTGIIAGTVVINNGAVIAPGSNSIGTLTTNNAVTLAAGSTTEIEINKSASTKDLLSTAGILTLNGTLKIVPVGTAAFAVDDSYKVFDAATIKGKFTAISPATPGDGLEWDTTALSSTGTIKVAISTAIGDFSSSVASVYPNPTTGKITVNKGETDGETTVTLETTNGELVMQQKGFKPSIFELDLTGKTAGVYMLKVSANQKTKVFKVVKK